MPGILAVPMLVPIGAFKHSLAVESLNVQPELEAKALLEWLGRGSRKGWADIDMPRSAGNPGLTAAIGYLWSIHCPGVVGIPGGPSSDWESLSTVETICCPPLSASGAVSCTESFHHAQAFLLLLVDLGPTQGHCRFYAWKWGAGHYPAPASVSGVIFVKPMAVGMLSHSHLNQKTLIKANVVCFWQ